MYINRLGVKENSLYHDAITFAGITDTASLPFVDFFRSANNWYRKADTWIWEASGTWEFDDANWTTLPEATTDLVGGQQDYELPSTARKIDRIEVLSTEGEYFHITPIDKSQIGAAMTEYLKEDGFPAQYDLVGRSLKLFPVPASGDVTTTKGLKVFYVRDISGFSITDTATEPGFDNHFHRIISLGAAYDYGLSNEMEDRKRLRIRDEIEQLKAEMQKHYGSRHREMKPKIIPRGNDSI